MNPELSGVAIGLLFGASKVLLIGTVGFAVAWWRSRLRIRQLEAELAERRELPEDRMARLEESTAEIAAQVARLADRQERGQPPRLGTGTD